MSFKIGNIEIKGSVGLAPMAGISNPPYMKICEEFGVSYAITELISSEAIVRKNKKTFEMLEGYENISYPVAVQLFGSNPSTMAQAAKIIVDKYNFPIVDINVGCPVPKVALRADAGSSLMKNPWRIKEIIESIKKEVDCPVTVKIRSGWDKNSINAVEVARLCEEAGASAICVHARTRSQGYSGDADWSIIKNVKESVSIPVLGNGDIKDYLSAKKMLDETGCDAVMVGRKALGNPWIFKEINSYLDKGIIEKNPTSIDKVEMCLKHLRYLAEMRNKHTAALEIRNHISWYLKGLKGSNDIKDRIYKTKDIKEIETILNEYKNNIEESV